MIDLETAIPKLNEVELRYEDLCAQMEAPENYQDPERIRQLGKDRAEIEETVEAYRAYRNALQGIEDNHMLLRDDDLKELAHEEIARFTAQKAQLEKRLLMLLVPVDPLDKKDIFLEIRAGTGGEEAALFASDLFRMYARYAENQNWKVEIMSISETEIGGLKEIVAQISGKRVYSMLKYEGGIHRVQRVPATESQGRVHTSAVTVAVMPEVDDIDIDIDETDLRIDVYRASGAGGQHVNKTESAVRITHIPSGIVVACQDERSQIKNRSRAMKILKARLYENARQERAQQEQDSRRAMVGSGDRSERIRTYNFPQNRMTEHRIGLTLYKLDLMMQGEIDDLIAALQAYFSAQALTH